MNKIRKAVLLALTALIVILQAGCAGKTKEPVIRHNFYFDTVCSIAIYDMADMSEDKANAAIDEAFKLCSRYESLLSRTKEGTDIYRINNAQGAPVECDPETVEVIRKGLYYSEMSGGVFDITIGKVTDLWDFHAEEPEVPAEDELREACDTVGWEKVQIEGNTVTLTDPRTHLDLGGIAKGFIADRVGEDLEKNGVTSAYISLGGNVACIGGKPGDGTETPFRIGVEKPYSNQSEIVGVVEAKDETVVTSGVYQRYFDADGTRYHHILNAETGYPAQTDIVGVTIRDAKGKSADCDALATIYLILGSEKAMQLAEESGGEIFMILSDGSFKSTEAMGFSPEQ
jgi:thiamine biosynthesis lipoprotein